MGWPSRRALVAVAITGAGSVAFACSDDDEPRQPPIATPTLARADDSPLALYGDRDTWNLNANDALLTGLLTREGNCLYMEYGDATAGERYLLALHAGITEWDDDRQVLTVTGIEMTLGDQVGFGGSGGDLSAGRWYVPPAPECDTSNVWIAGEAVDLIVLEDHSRPPDSTPDDDPIRRDAEWYAEANGISVEEAIRRLEAQGKAGEFGARLQEAACNRYAGHWVEHEPEYGLVLALAGDDEAPVDLLALAAEGPVPVTVNPEPALLCRAPRRTGSAQPCTVGRNRHLRRRAPQRRRCHVGGRANGLGDRRDGSRLACRARRPRAHRTDREARPRWWRRLGRRYTGAGARMKSHTFTIVIEKELEDPGFYAHCPTLPGCFGAGLTVEETVEDMRAAIALYLEDLIEHGEPIPVDVGQPTIREVTLDVPA